ncbi:MAG: ATP-dependent DNA helicase [Patescibacteria group bacterium]
MANAYSTGNVICFEAITLRELTAGVKDLLDILYHPRDLGIPTAPPERAHEGGEGHRLVAAARPRGYRFEVPVEHAYEARGYRLVVRGRIDGLFDPAAGGAHAPDPDPDTDTDTDGDTDSDYDSDGDGDYTGQGWEDDGPGTDISPDRLTPTPSQKSGGRGVGSDHPPSDERRVTSNEIIVEEIKTTYLPLADLHLEKWPAHAAQLRLYVHMVRCANPGRKVAGRLTYVNLDDLSERTFSPDLGEEETRDFFVSLAEGYLAHVRALDDWRGVRDESLAAWDFPFAERRAGQDELMETVAAAVRAERDLFAEAATGIGKTAAVLYPALKGLASGGRYQRVFFLTAKTSGKMILRKTLELAREGGLRLRAVFIEAKEKVCLHPEADCTPQDCPCARDYYARAAAVITDLLRLELITPEAVLEAARRETLCPFELSLDLALRADLIVGDYNYVFDPGVYLRRFFGQGGRRDSLFLVDEAHNLVQRGREMYSASLDSADLARLAEELGDLDCGIVRECEEAGRFFQAWREEMAAEGRRGLLLSSSLPEMLPPALERLAGAMDRVFARRPPADLRRRWRDFYFDLQHLLRVAGHTGRDYAVYALAREGGGVLLRLFCQNPGPLLRRRLDQGRSAVFFSATLSPFAYFRDLLGGGRDALHLRLPSPFPVENRLYLHVPGIDTRYRAREETALALARVAAAMVAARAGNYLMFFPSYAYLNAVRPLVERLLAGRAAVLAQSPAMRDEQKRRFLEKLAATDTGRSTLGLAVLGGIFGEGIDLPGERLVGVCIAGPGLPQVSEEQELIRSYFQERNEQGFLYAYLIPGLIRVVQSAGRVFRGPEDRGVVILVDDRFLHEAYQELLPPDWFAPGREFSREDVGEALREFWGDSPPSPHATG